MNLLKTRSSSTIELFELSYEFQKKTTSRTDIPFKRKPTEICWYQLSDLFLPFFQYKLHPKFVFYTQILSVSLKHTGIYFNHRHIIAFAQ
jgi:hypothetical protein